MAYYAAVISLKVTINRFLNSSQISFLPHNREIIEFVYKEVSSMQQVLQKLEQQLLKNSTNDKVNALLGQIRDAACKLEDSLESHVSDKYFSQSEILGVGRVLILPPDYLKEVRQGINYIKETMEKLEETMMQEVRNPPLAEEDVSPRIHCGGEESSKMVGFSDLFNDMKYVLTKHISQYELGFVSIVGMAGIGKSRLAKEIYEDQFDHFECCAWIIIGPECQLKKVIVYDKLHEEEDEILVEDLYSSLKGRKYLIVVDDIWSKHDWDKLKSLLPEDNNGSRVLLTTRLEEVAKYANKSYTYLRMRFLDEEESWDLLRQKVFGEECSCPFQLEKAGRKIAKKCEGLPLTIITVANILSKSDKTREYWNKVAEEKYSSVFTNAYEQMSKVLFPSYKYLPQHLKAIFLYMGVFPPSSEICASKLIRLWIAERFLEPKEVTYLEDFGMECLRSLVSSSVLLAQYGSSLILIKSCRINSAFWYLCTREARKEKFFHVLRTYPNSFTEGVESQRRFCIFNNILFGIKDVHKLMKSITSVHSLLCTGPEHLYPVPLFTNLRLLRVLDAITIRFYTFPVQVLKLVHLRYLALTCSGNVPASISNLWNLQYLIVCRLLSIKKSSSNLSYLPIEIWDMQELKHLQIMGSNLPDPCGAILSNMLSVSEMSVNSCTKEILEKVPNLRILHVRIELAPDADETMFCFDHLYVLHGLESFKCAIINPNPSRSQVVAPPISVTTFPFGLKKLSLSGFGYPWECISVIAQLPNLKTLKLRCYAFRGPEWVLHDGEFVTLQYLLLEDIDLVHWKTDGHGFPSLDHLVIRHCYKLKEMTSNLMRVCGSKVDIVDCPLVVDSIEQLQKKNRFPIRLSVNNSWEDGKLNS